MSLGRTYRFLGRAADAEAQFRKAVEIDPTWHLPYVGLATIQSSRGELARAIETGQTALSVEGDEARFAEALCSLIGYNYQTLGEFAVAEHWFERADRLRGNMRLHGLLARNRYRDADSLLEHWSAEEPDNPNVFMLGALYRTVIGERAEAIRMLEHIVDHPAGVGDRELLVREFLFWGYSPAVYLAFLYLENGRPDRANDLLAQADRFVLPLESDDSGYPGVDYVRASIHALRGEDDAALESLRRAAERGWSQLWFLERDPILGRYSDDPRFRSAVTVLADRISDQRAQLDRPES